MNSNIPERFKLLCAHFETLYSRFDDLDDALQALSPASLSEPQVVSLKSTAFLSAPGLQRLEETCSIIAVQIRSHRSTKHVLDIGCGRGRLGVYLAQLLDCTLIGIDLAKSAIRSAKSEFEHEAIFLCGNFMYLPFASASFDIILAIDCLHLCTDVPSILTEIRRVLPKGGILIASAYRFGYSIATDRDNAWWQACLTQSGFVIQQWTDVTTEWRREMTAKHRNRWDKRHYLINTFGDRAFAECKVSSYMLGEDGHDSFIEKNSRWEFVAITC